MVNRLKNTLKVWGWRLALAGIVFALVFFYLYNLIRPMAKIDVEDMLSSTQVKLREEEIKGELEKEKIKVIKDIYEDRFKKSEEIKDREERLKELVKIYEELKTSRRL
jgi:flagellar biosynthesis/type III secretory pathway M-ring protein FliF/YscJ